MCTHTHKHTRVQALHSDARAHVRCPFLPGDLPTLRLVQALSRRRHPVKGSDVSGLGMNSGTHMAINMAAGGRGGLELQPASTLGAGSKGARGVGLISP